MRTFRANAQDNYKPDSVSRPFGKECFYSMPKGRDGNHFSWRAVTGALVRLPCPSTSPRGNFVLHLVRIWPFHPLTCKQVRGYAPNNQGARISFPISASLFAPLGSPPTAVSRYVAQPFWQRIILFHTKRAGQESGLSSPPF